jgi:hypothetical protein
MAASRNVLHCIGNARGMQYLKSFSPFIADNSAAPIPDGIATAP